MNTADYIYILVAVWNIVSLIDTGPASATMAKFTTATMVVMIAINALFEFVI